MTKKKKATDEGLPYFKFFISKWSTGNIQQCSHSAQGLFMNLCVLYWGQRGELLLSKMQKRFGRKQKYFAELISEDVIKINGDAIQIFFLDEQLLELGYVSETNRQNALLRWNQIKPDATALPPHSERTANGMPIEERREEEKRIEEKREEAAPSVDEIVVVQLTAEALDLVDGVCDYFAVKKITTSIMYDTVCEYASTLLHRNELQIASIALKNYVAYKKLSQEQRHSVSSWMGTMDKNFRDGVWIMMDWESKLKTLQYASDKRGVRETSPAPGKDYSEKF